VCCEAPLGCAGMCVQDCRNGGSCSPGLTCNMATGVCSPAGDGGMPPHGDGGMPPPQDGGGSDASTSACGTCQSGYVCCEQPLKCAGTCVPDCRVTNMCPQNLTCDTSNGVCSPGGDGGMPPPGDGGKPPPGDGGKPPPGDGGMPPPGDGGTPPGDGGMPPPADGGATDGGASDGGTLADGGSYEGEITGQGVWGPAYNANNVSISNTTIALGSESSNCESGEALVYVWDGSAWTVQQAISGNGALCYGASVSLYQDTLFVGAPMDKVSGVPDGAVFVYARSNGTWTQQQEITNASTQYFGWSESVDGTQAAIGAPHAYLSQGTQPQAGEVFVYTKSGPQWSQSAAITAPLPVTDGEFGESVALNGTTLVVGAPGDWISGANTQPGTVYGFTQVGSSWYLQNAVQPANVGVHDLFGFSVATAGHTMIAGAPNNSDNGANAGKAWIYVLSNNTSWVETQPISPTDAAAGAQFGYTVAAISDNEVLVGAPGAQKVYLFTLANGAWTQTTSYTACTSSELGWNLATNGTLAVSGRNNDWIIDLTQPNTACIGP